MFAKVSIECELIKVEHIYIEVPLGDLNHKRILCGNARSFIYLVKLSNCPLQGTHFKCTSDVHFKFN